MWQWFVDHGAEEWRVLSGAPIASLFLVAIGAFVAWWLNERHYSALRDRLEARKDEISDLKAKLIAQASAPAMVSVEDSKSERRRNLLHRCRTVAVNYLTESKGETFRQFLEGKLSYAEVRPYLSEDYLKKLNNGRMLTGAEMGAKYPALLQWFLDDLDRLEREWDVAL